MSGTEAPDRSARIRTVIEEFIRHSPENTLRNPLDDRAFDTPLVGFARGDDAIFEAFKEHVGPFHWTPAEVFRLTFPDLTVTPDELTVISWILPQTEATKADNRKESRFPSDRWARARIFGEEVNVKLRRLVVDSLTEAGYASIAPQLSPQWSLEMSERYGFASTWSERHVAHACGLGTFGLSDGLITSKGKAMRAGSVVAHVKVSPTKRPYDDHHAYCLHFTKGICGRCIKRCPVDAITTESGHDKETCREHVKIASGAYVKEHYGFDGYGCGLCQTRVPCESKIPTRKDVDSS